MIVEDLMSSSFSVHRFTLALNDPLGDSNAWHKELMPVNVDPIFLT